MLKSCDEINNNDNIKFNSENIKWYNFKLSKFPNWTFDSDYKEENRKKNNKIWNFIGNDLCN